jgi:hypothetical protein
LSNTSRDCGPIAALVVFPSGQRTEILSARVPCGGLKKSVGGDWDR